MEQSKFRWVIVIIWAMLFCMDFIIWLHNGDLIVLFLAGLQLGGTLVLLMDTPFMNMEGKLLNQAMKSWRKALDYNRRLNDLIYAMDTKPKSRKKK